MLKNICTFIVCVLITIGLCSAVHASKVTVLIGPEDVSTYSPSDNNLGDYYILDLQLPAELNKNDFQMAYLEFFVDVSSREVSGYTNDTPVLELYALASAFTGQLDPTQFASEPGRIGRNVVVGQNKRVVVDITAIVKSYLDEPFKNHGLIIGSLTGVREGLFSIKANSFDEGAAAKVTFFSATELPPDPVEP